MHEYKEIHHNLQHSVKDSILQAITNNLASLPITQKSYKHTKSWKKGDEEAVKEPESMMDIITSIFVLKLNKVEISLTWRKTFLIIKITETRINFLHKVVVVFMPEFSK